MPYLSTNAFPSGQRWRCRVCEKFVSPSDLQICSLTAALVEEFKDKGHADRVEFYSDGTYTLLDEPTRKYQNRGMNVSATNKEQQKVNTVTNNTIDLL